MSTGMYDRHGRHVPLGVPCVPPYGQGMRSLGTDTGNAYGAGTRAHTAGNDSANVWGCLAIGIVAIMVAVLVAVGIAVVGACLYVLSAV
jgi:hypothetical protein